MTFCFHSTFMRDHFRINTLVKVECKWNINGTSSAYTSSSSQEKEVFTWSNPESLMNRKFLRVIISPFSGKSIPTESSRKKSTLKKLAAQAAKKCQLRLVGILPRRWCRSLLEQQAPKVHHGISTFHLIIVLAVSFENIIFTFSWMNVPYKRLQMRSVKNMFHLLLYSTSLSLLGRNCVFICFGISRSSFTK